MARSTTLDSTQLKRPKRGANAAQNPVRTIRGKAPLTNSKAACALVDEDKPLTAQQLAFVKAWAQGESIASASQRAGYSAGDGFCYRMTAMPNVLKVYHAEKALYAASCQMTRKRVMDGLLEGVEMARLMAEPMTLIAGWREIGKMCGYYEPTKLQVEHNHKGEVTVRQLNGMSDAELVALIKGGSLPQLQGPSDEHDVHGG
jgi:phage terminase small subunit